MQVEKDFLMRQFKQLGDVLAQVLSNKGSVRSEESLETIGNALGELRKNEEKRFQELSLEETVSAVRVDDQFNAELAFIVADLLYEEAQIAGEELSRKCIMQALLLYKLASRDPEAAVPMHAHERTRELELELTPRALESVNTLVLAE